MVVSLLHYFEIDVDVGNHINRLAFQLRRYEAPLTHALDRLLGQPIREAFENPYVTDKASLGNHDFEFDRALDLVGECVFACIEASLF